MKNPRINVYQCEYGCQTVTVDVDKGVTPFMIKCKATSRPDRPLLLHLTGADGECIGTTKSSMYPSGPKPPHIRDPEWEWFKPSPDDIEKECDQHPEFEDDIRDFYASGETLMLRKRTDREPIYQEDSE